MVNGTTSGRSGIGSVKTTWRRSGVTGSGVSTICPIAWDQAPAAHTTVPAVIGPRPVCTVRAWPATTSMSVTVTPVSRVAPWRRAPRA